MSLSIKKASASTAAKGPKVSLPGKPKDVQKRWLYVAAGLAFVVMAGTMVFGDNQNQPPPAPKKKTEAPTISTTPPSADKQAYDATIGRDMEALKQKIAQLEAEKSKSTPPVTPVALPPGITPPPQQGNTGGLAPLQAVAPPKLPEALRAQSEPAVATPRLSPNGRQATGSDESVPQLSAPLADPASFDPPARAAAQGASDTGGAKTPEGFKAKTKYQKNASAGMLPAGAFAGVSLLNGFEAGTSSSTQSNPMPVLMNVTSQATLPGAAKYKIRNCFVLGAGYGDMSSERVYIRFSRLSCMDKSDRLVLSQEVQGYVVDSDGKLGLRGIIYDRQGARLGKALLAGFAQGLTSAMGSSQSTVTSGALGSTNSLSGANALRASGLTGASTAANQLAEFYLNEAKAMFPVVSVDAGRIATIVFTSSVALNWSSTDSQFTAQVTPTN